MFSPALHLTRGANSFTVLSCGFIQVHTPSLATIKTWQRWQTRLDDPCDAPGPAARPCLQKAVPLLSSSQTLRGWRNNLQETSRSLVVISLFFQFFTEHDWPSVIYWIIVTYCYPLLTFVVAIWYRKLPVVGPAALRESWRCHIRGGHPNPPSFVSHSDLQGLQIGDGQMIWLISWFWSKGQCHFWKTVPISI